MTTATMCLRPAFGPVQCRSRVLSEGRRTRTKNTTKPSRFMTSWTITPLRRVAMVGPYRLCLALADRRLAITVTTEMRAPILCPLSLTPFRRHGASRDCAVSDRRHHGGGGRVPCGEECEITVADTASDQEATPRVPKPQFRLVVLSH